MYLVLNDVLKDWMYTICNSRVNLTYMPNTFTFIFQNNWVHFFYNYIPLEPYCNSSFSLLRIFVTLMYNNFKIYIFIFFINNFKM